jgi:hypothetical protein
VQVSAFSVVHGESTECRHQPSVTAIMRSQLSVVTGNPVRQDEVALAKVIAACVSRSRALA